MGGIRVVLLSYHSVFAAAVESILKVTDGIELRTIRGDDPQASAEIGRIAPDVIVIDSGEERSGKAEIAHLLEVHPLARIVAVDVNRQDIEVYRIKRVMRTTPEGLKKAIQGGRRRTASVAQARKTPRAASAARRAQHRVGASEEVSDE